MYVKPGCPYCQAAREALAAEGASVEERDATGNPAWREELMRHTRNRGTVRHELYAIALTGTECELVVYPREGHVPVERAHLLDALQRTQAWFDRHLKPAGT